MITYAEITTLVAGNIKIDYNATDLARFKVVDNINAAVREILNTMPSEFLSEAIKTITFNLAINVSAYQFPTDYVRFIKMWIRWTSTTKFIECGELPVSVGDTDLSLDNQPSKEFPKVDLSAERGFYVLPTPTANCTNGGRMKYIYQFPAVATDQDCMLDVKWKNFIAARASMLSAGVEGSKPDLVTLWAGVYNAERNFFLPKSEKK